jgi:hypothetical protein
MDAINSLFSKAVTGKELPETPVCGARERNRGMLKTCVLAFP